MVADDYKQRSTEESEMPAECYTDDNRTETEFIRTRVSNYRLKTGKASLVWHGRWNWNPRKTKKRMAGRRQGLVPDGRAFGTGPP
jgi:hypothetical protein